MRILQIVPSISLVYGGPSQMVLGLSAALVSEGVDVIILTTNSNGDFGQLPLDVPLEQPIEQNGYKIIYFPCSPFRRYKFSWDLLRWLFSHAQEYNLAHIHALFSPISTAAATVARYKKLPYILRPLGTLDPADLEKKKRLKKIYAFLFERPNLLGASAVHFTSAQEAKVSERYGVITNDLVIPLGVNQLESLPIPGKIRQQLGIDENIPLILFMSRIDPKKGLNLLIEALESLLKSGLNFHFILAGSNPQDSDYENQIKEQISNLALSQYTTITGFIGGELKLGLLQDANLFVLPSYYENFGIAVAEAMVIGTPVVISNQVHIWQDIDKASAGWICTCDVESLTKQLKLALEDGEERKRRGLNAQKFALENYSWKAISQQMITAYQMLIDNSVSPK